MSVQGNRITSIGCILVNTYVQREIYPYSICGVISGCLLASIELWITKANASSGSLIILKTEGDWILL